MDNFIKYLRKTLLIFFITWGVIWLSMRAFNKVSKGDQGVFNRVLVELYRAPYNIKLWYNENFLNEFQSTDVKPSDNIKPLGMFYDNDKVKDSIYLLHSVYHDQNNTKVLLQNIKTGTIEKSWNISLEVIRKDFDSIRKSIRLKSKTGEATLNMDFYIPSTNNAILIRTPFMLKDSSLIFHSQYLGFVYKIDKNSKFIWKSKRLTHHSLEVDSYGNFWTCSYDFENQKKNLYKYRDDAIYGLDKNGNEIFFKSLSQVFKENKLFKSLIESSPIRNTKSGLDPFHLNDVQPVFKNGKNWKKDDLFLSIRDKSMVLLYRPVSNEIVWYKIGPWNKQHDVNIENDSIISIFNNNASFFDNKVSSSSSIMFYDFTSDETRNKFQGLFSSATEGRQTIMEDQILIEETNAGLYYLLGNEENLIGKFYVPFALDSSRAQYPSWSRVYQKDNGVYLEQ